MEKNGADLKSATGRGPTGVESKAKKGSKGEVEKLSWMKVTR